MVRRKITTLKIRTLFFLFATFIFLLFLIFAFFQYHGPDKKTNRIEELTEAIVKQCKTSTNKTFCYETLILPLMDTPIQLNFLAAFDVIEHAQNLDPDFLYCHNLSHELGKKAFKQDESNWKKAATECPSICSKGCLHGVFQEKFKNEIMTDSQITDIKNELKSLCGPREDWQPVQNEINSCYHGLGHLLILITDSSAERSLNFCNQLTQNTNPNSLNSCMHGLFMQIFQPLGPEVGDVPKNILPTPEEAKTLCDKFTGNIQTTCWIESWPVKRSQIQSPEGLVAFCEELPYQSAQQDCLKFMFYKLSYIFHYDKNKLTKFCENIRDPLKADCIAMVAINHMQSGNRFVEESIKFCEEAENIDPWQKCFELLAYNIPFNFKSDSEEKKKLCEKIPAKWQTKCFRGI